MKLRIVAVGILLLATGGALAADLPTRKAPLAPPLQVFSWTGCYGGGDVGGAWDRQPTSIAPVAVDQDAVASDIAVDNIYGGVYAGCNYEFSQMAPAWVVGAEADVSWAKLGGTATGPNLSTGGAVLPGGVTWRSSADWLSSARARLGWAVAPNVLLYATGAAAWTRVNYSGLDVFNTGCPNCLAASFGGDRAGWVAGGGIDWAPWSNNWILRAEYLHYQFDGQSGTAAFNASQRVTFGFGKLDVDAVRVGLAYKL